LYDDFAHLVAYSGGRRVAKPLVQVKVFLATESAGQGEQEGVFAVVELAAFKVEKLRDLCNLRGYLVGSFAEVDGLGACYCIFADENPELCGKILECGEIGE
jgi:hypothetical protein